MDGVGIRTRNESDGGTYVRGIVWPLEAINETTMRFPIKDMVQQLQYYVVAVLRIVNN